MDLPLENTKPKIEGTQSQAKFTNHETHIAKLSEPLNGLGLDHILV